MTRDWFTVERRGDQLVIAGELDSTVLDELRALLTARSAVRLDLGEVSFIDSPALHVLIAERERLGTGFEIVAPSTVVARLFQLAGVAALLTPSDAPPE